MSKKLKQIEAQHIDSNTAVLSGTEGMVKSWSSLESAASDVGFHRDLEFLISLGLCTLDTLPSSRDEIKSLLQESFAVLYRLKRGAAFKLGGVTLLANRFGVMTFVTRCEHFKGYGSINLVRCNQMIHELLGSYQDGYDRGEPIYNYSERRG